MARPGVAARHRNSTATPPHHRNSASLSDDDDLPKNYHLLLFLTPHVLLLFRICPCLVPCFSFFQILC